MRVMDPSMVIISIEMRKKKKKKKKTCRLAFVAGNHALRDSLLFFVVVDGRSGESQKEERSLQISERCPSVLFSVHRVVMSFFFFLLFLVHHREDYMGHPPEAILIIIIHTKNIYINFK